MKKTILSLVMMLTMAMAVSAGPVIKATPASKTNVEFKGDSIIVNDGDQSVTVSGLPELQRVRDKINEALDDTLTTGNGAAIGIGDHDLSPEDIKYMSDHWGEIAKQMCYASIAGLLALVALVLLFRYLNRRNKYRVMEKAIENNYPLNDLSLNDVRRNAIYVQQPVFSTPVPPAAPGAPQQPGQVPVGTPIKGQTPDNPIIMTNVMNWRALMPAIRVLGWGLFILLFGLFVAGGNDPFEVIGLALIFVGLCKGFILYKEQKALQEAANRAQQMPPYGPVREGTPMPPNFDADYKEDDSTPYQPY
jgi:hypothetical protein